MAIANAEITRAVTESNRNALRDQIKASMEDRLERLITCAASEGRTSVYMSVSNWKGWATRFSLVDDDFCSEILGTILFELSEKGYKTDVVETEGQEHLAEIKW